MIDPDRWKEISRRRLTACEARAYIAGDTPSSGERSFDVVVVTQFKQNPFKAIQITYEKIPQPKGTPQ